MLIEELNQRLFTTKEKLSKIEKALRVYESKYHGVNISELHKTIRNLENKVELFKNQHVFNSKIEETFRVCRICRNQIDANDVRVKKLVVEGGRKQKDNIPVSLFLSSEEDPTMKDQIQANLLRQPKIMLDLMKIEKGFSSDIEDFKLENSFSSSSEEKVHFVKDFVIKR
jgi:hypothetical protein